MPSLPRRPWYLAAALVAAWVLGSVTSLQGCQEMMFYQDATAEIETRPDDAESSKAVTLAYEHLVDTMDAAKARVLPLAIASFLLGTAMFMLSTRAMFGRASARAALVQVVLVQAAVAVASTWLTADVDAARFRFGMALPRPSIFAKLPPDVVAESERAARPTALVLHLFVNGLIVVALTRRRTRAFYDAVSASLEGG